MTIRTKLGLTFGLAAALGFVAGCQDSTTYETRKPVYEESTGEQIDDAAEEASEEIREAGEAAADAVTPDERIVDIQTPLGDVKVDRDPATDGVDVDVDSRPANVDVSTDN